MTIPAWTGAVVTAVLAVCVASCNGGDRAPETGFIIFDFDALDVSQAIDATDNRTAVDALDAAADACADRLCAGVCVNTVTDRLNCGACSVICGSGMVCQASACIAPPPRLIAPLSTATVTSQTPTLRWQFIDGASSAHIEICEDRACAHVEQSLDAVGNSAVPVSALRSGVHFWHATTDGLHFSFTWQFTVGARSAPVDTSWGTTLDANGDGFAEVAVGADTSNTTYVYSGSAVGVASTPIVLTGPVGGSSFGSSLASAGDVNGDGFSDLVIGAYFANTIYVYLGSASGIVATPLAITAPSSSFFGVSIASAGDVNGDGFADIVVGSHADAAAFVYFGSASGLAGTPTTIGDAGAAAGFVVWVASAGDVNGDGFADVVLGMPSSNTAMIYAGSATGVGSAPAVLPAPTASVEFGTTVASAGDVNGDGFADVVVGTSDLVDGAAYVFLGSSSGVGTVPTTLASPIGSAAFGNPVASVGDVDGDGFGDVIVGAPTSGTAYLYRGSALGVVTTPTALSGAVPFGLATASAGDVDRDGFGDIVVGAPSMSRDSGAAYVFFGSATGVRAAPTILTAPLRSDDFGASVAAAIETNEHDVMHVRMRQRRCIAGRT